MVGMDTTGLSATAQPKNHATLQKKTPLRVANVAAGHVGDRHQLAQASPGSPQYSLRSTGSSSSASSTWIVMM
jgi:hypothetical protein